MHSFRGAVRFVAGWLCWPSNRAIDMIRRRKPTNSPDDVVLVSNANLASDTERNVLMEKVRIFLKELPMEQQKSLDLAYFEGLTTRRLQKEPVTRSAR